MRRRSPAQGAFDQLYRALVRCELILGRVIEDLRANPAHCERALGCLLSVHLDHFARAKRLYRQTQDPCHRAVAEKLAEADECLDYAFSALDCRDVKSALIDMERSLKCIAEARAEVETFSTLRPSLMLRFQRVMWRGRRKGGSKRPYLS